MEDVGYCLLCHEENLHFARHLCIYIIYASQRILTTTLIIIARNVFSLQYELKFICNIEDSVR
jgi:hypothetical protein